MKPSKSKIKKMYLNAEIGISDAVRMLMFDHSMDRNAALKFLGL